MILFVNYLGKMRGYPQFSFWISITLVKINISCVIINRGKNTIELVGTILNRREILKYTQSFVVVSVVATFLQKTKEMKVHIIHTTEVRRVGGGGCLGKLLDMSSV